MAALPERAQNALLRAKSLLAAGQPQQAIAEIDKVLRKAPKAAEAWWVLGKARDAAGEAEGAERAFRHAATLMPRSYDIWFSLGLSLSLRQRYADAAAAYERALNVTKAFEPTALHNLGSCFIELGRHDDAAKIFDALIKFGWDNADVRALLQRARELAAEGPQA